MLTEYLCNLGDEVDWVALEGGIPRQGLRWLAHHAVGRTLKKRRPLKNRNSYAHSQTGSPLTGSPCCRADSAQEKTIFTNRYAHALTQTRYMYIVHSAQEKTTVKKRQVFADESPYRIWFLECIMGRVEDSIRLHSSPFRNKQRYELTIKSSAPQEKF